MVRLPAEGGQVVVFDAIAVELKELAAVPPCNFQQVDDGLGETGMGSDVLVKEPSSTTEEPSWTPV